MGTAQEVLRFWFGKRAEENRHTLWFGADPAVDDMIRIRFGDTVGAALRGDLDHWARSARGRLALIIVLDQFTRHVHRGTKRAFAGDRAAQRHAMKAIAQGEDHYLGPFERNFLYMPLMHAEDLELQRRGTAAFERLTMDARPSLRTMMGQQRDSARDHAAIVSRFGRFPDRNELLGRDTTDEERRFLEQAPREWFSTMRQDARPQGSRDP